MLTGIAALYVSFAEVTNGAFGRTVVPLGSPIIKEGGVMKEGVITPPSDIRAA
jgi:hypothetical protein